MLRGGVYVVAQYQSLHCTRDTYTLGCSLACPTVSTAVAAGTAVRREGRRLVPYVLLPLCAYRKNKEHGRYLRAIVINLGDDRIDKHNCGVERTLRRW